MDYALKHLVPLWAIAQVILGLLDNVIIKPKLSKDFKELSQR